MKGGAADADALDAAYRMISVHCRERQSWVVVMGLGMFFCAQLLPVLLGVDLSRLLFFARPTGDQYALLAEAEGPDLYRRHIFGRRAILRLAMDLILALTTWATVAGTKAEGFRDGMGYQTLACVVLVRCLISVLQVACYKAVPLICSGRDAHELLDCRTKVCSTIDLCVLYVNATLFFPFLCEGSRRGLMGGHLPIIMIGAAFPIMMAPHALAGPGKGFTKLVHMFTYIDIFTLICIGDLYLGPKGLGGLYLMATGLLHVSFLCVIFVQARVPDAAAFLASRAGAGDLLQNDHRSSPPTSAFALAMVAVRRVMSNEPQDDVLSSFWRVFALGAFSVIWYRPLVAFLRAYAAASGELEGRDSADAFAGGGGFSASRRHQLPSHLQHPWLRASAAGVALSLALALSYKGLAKPPKGLRSLCVYCPCCTSSSPSSSAAAAAAAAATATAVPALLKATAAVTAAAPEGPTSSSTAMASAATATKLAAKSLPCAVSRRLHVAWAALFAGCVASLFIAMPVWEDVPNNLSWGEVALFLAPQLTGLAAGTAIISRASSHQSALAVLHAWAMAVPALQLCQGVASYCFVGDSVYSLDRMIAIAFPRMSISILAALAVTCQVMFNQVGVAWPQAVGQLAFFALRFWLIVDGHLESLLVWSTMGVIFIIGAAVLVERRVQSNGSHSAPRQEEATDISLWATKVL